MKCSEIDAFTAQKNAGSRLVYFELIANFIQRAPALVEGLSLSVRAKDLDSVVRTGYALQKPLLSIGASALLWETEKVLEAAGSGEWKKCGDKAFILVARIKHLCTKLDGAKIDPSAGAMGTSTDTAILAVQSGVGNTGAPSAIADAEKLEKLRYQIENFEIDAAALLLKSLRQFSYGYKMDSILASIQADLENFAYEDAVPQAKHLLDLAKERREIGGADEDKKKVLAVDDMAVTLSTVKNALEESYTVYAVTNHVTALKFLTTNKADLILLDIEMPEMDGFELLGFIRKIGAYKMTPVLFLTGSVTVENVIRSRRTGANDFIKKPVEPQILLAKVRKYLP